MEICDHGPAYSVVFYDVTNLPVDLAATSDAIRGMYASYLELVQIPHADVAPFVEQPYLFTVLVNREHASWIADALFDYLVSRLRAHD